MPSGIMPETVSVTTCPDGRCEQIDISIKNAGYYLRPEAVESLFILYRVTGEMEWQDKAWQTFMAIERAARTDLAYAALENVAVESPPQMDKMESFWTAETLKYFYLIFSSPCHEPR